MSDAINFNFENLPISVINNDYELWFNARQLTHVLGFKNPRQALLSHVDEEDVQKLDTLTDGGKQKVSYVNESGMYALIFGSVKPEAKRFKKWVTSEALPSIRKTGSYSIEESKYSKMSPEQQKVIESAIRQRAHVLATLVQPMYEHHMRTGKIVFKTHDDVQKWYPQDDPYLSPRAGINLEPIKFPKLRVSNNMFSSERSFTYKSWLMMHDHHEAPILKLIQQLKEQGFDTAAVWEEYTLLEELLRMQNESFTFFKRHCERPHAVSF